MTALPKEDHRHQECSFQTNSMAEKSHQLWAAPSASSSVEAPLRLLTAGSSEGNIVAAADLFRRGSTTAEAHQMQAIRDVRIDYVEAFEADLARTAIGDGELVERAIDRIADGVVEGRPPRALGLRQPQRILLWDQDLESSLYVAPMPAGMAAVLAVDLDPLDDSTVLTLLRLVPAEDADEAYLTTASLLFASDGIPFRVE